MVVLIATAIEVEEVDELFAVLVVPFPARHEQAEDTRAGIPAHWETNVGMLAGAVIVAAV